ncbi:hypothetical protein B0H21DRAFT_822902 [Amylocystis lapponica]|nr:hypothetical protein B0H21DRAFT_822902 [Amylocystis lapponica]
MAKRSKKDGESKQPPRPPNAWILYRSDKMHQLPAKQPGTKGPLQADISRELSKAWRAESDQVRTYYEQMAEIRKTQHQAMYPNYQFKPVKKEEKLKMRQQKKEEKDRARESKKQKSRYTPYPNPAMVSSAHIPYYSTSANYGTEGPSPPLSAASLPSPTSTPSTPESQLGSESFRPHSSQASSSSGASSGSRRYPTAIRSKPSSRHTSSSAVARPRPQSTLHAPMPSSVQPMLPQAMWPHPPPHPSTSNASPDASSDPGFSQQWSFDSSTPASAGPSTPWAMDDAPATAGPSNMWMLGANTPPPSVPLTPLSLHVPTPPSFLNSDWLNLPEDDPLHAMAMATHDPSIFQLSGFDETLLMHPPPSEIDISLPPVSYFTNIAETNPDMCAAFELLISQLDENNVNAGPAGENLDHMFLAGTDPEEEEETSISDESLLQYLNLDFTPLPDDVPAHTVPAAPTQMQMQTMPANPSPSVHTPYVPPAGAANASTRRVAGSWRPAPTQTVSPPDSPIEHAPMSWSFPEN